MKACFHVPRLYRQQGAVLFTCLIFLLIITMIGVIASQTMVLEEKMAGNLSANSMAFAGAEAGLRNCERRLRILLTLPKPQDSTNNLWIWRLDNPNPNSGTPGFNPNTPPWWMLRNGAWWQANGDGQGGGGTSYSYNNLPNNLNGLQQSSCVIEYLGQQKESLNEGTNTQKQDNNNIKYYYRITARSSTGDNNNTVVILQSVFYWKYESN